MDMTDVFEKLKDLQTVLLRKNELENKIANAPSVLNTHEQLLARLKQEYIEKNADFEAVRAEVNRLKADLFQVELNRQNAEKAMETVETQRDYETLESSIKKAKAEADQIREKLEYETEHFRNIDESIKEDEKVIGENEAEINAMKDSLDSENKKMSEEIKELDAQKKALSKGLDSETIFKFERIVKNKQGDGIVAVRGGVCSGCHMILPAQFANEVQSETELKYCPYCSRVLYYEQSDTDLDDFSFDDADIGGLADLADG